MAKGKKSSGKHYTSQGVHSNVRTGTLQAMRAARCENGERVFNQLKAFRAGKKVMVTIPNPDKEAKDKLFIRVNAKEVWKNQAGEGFIMAGA